MGSDTDWGVPSSTLTLPPFAGPNDSQITIGPDIPPELVTWAAGVGSTLDAVIIYRRNATEYVWEGIGTFVGNTTRFRGTYDPVFGVVITQRTVIVAGTGLSERFGAAFNPPGSNVSVDYIVGTDITYDLVSMPRSVVAFAGVASNSAAVGAEATVITTGFTAYRAGRVYEAMYYGETVNPGVADTVIYRCRRTNLAGALVMASAFILSTTPGNTQNCSGRFLFTPSVDIGDTFVLTLQSVAGGAIMGGSSTSLRYFEIMDHGSTANFANVITV